jgi:hypothetical protein
VCGRGPMRSDGESDGRKFHFVILAWGVKGKKNEAFRPTVAWLISFG